MLILMTVCALSILFFLWLHIRNQPHSAVFFSAKFLLPTKLSSTQQSLKRMKAIPWSLFLLRAAITSLCLYAIFGYPDQKKIDLYWSSPPTVEQIHLLENLHQTNPKVKDQVRFLDLSDKSYDIDSLYQIPFSINATQETLSGIQLPITAIEKIWQRDLDISFSINEGILALQKKYKLPPIEACLSLKSKDQIDCFPFQQSQTNPTLFALKIESQTLSQLGYSPYDILLGEIIWDSSNVFAQKKNLLSTEIKLPNYPICIPPKRIHLQGDFSWFKALNQILDEEEIFSTSQINVANENHITWRQTHMPLMTQTSGNIQDQNKTKHLEHPWLPWVKKVHWDWQSGLSGLVQPLREAEFPQPTWLLQNISSLGSSHLGASQSYDWEDDFLWVKTEGSLGEHHRLIPIAKDIVDFSQNTDAVRILGFDPKQLTIDLDVLSLMMSRYEKDLERFAGCRSLDDQQEISIFANMEMTLKSPSQKEEKLGKKAIISAKNLKEIGLYKISNDAQQEAWIAYQPHQIDLNKTTKTTEQIKDLSHHFDELWPKQDHHLFIFQKWILFALITLSILLNIRKLSLWSGLIIAILSLIFFLRPLQIHSLSVLIHDEQLAQKWQNALISEEISFSVDTPQVQKDLQASTFFLSDHLQTPTQGSQWLIAPKKTFSFFQIKDIHIQPSFDSSICQIQIIFDPIKDEVKQLFFNQLQTQPLNPQELKQSIAIQIFGLNDQVLGEFDLPLQEQSASYAFPCVSQAIRDANANVNVNVNANANAILISEIQLKISPNFPKNWLKAFNTQAEMIGFHMDDQPLIYRLKPPPSSQLLALAYGQYAQKYALDAGFEVSAHLHQLDDLNEQVKAIFLDNVDVSWISNLQVQKLGQWLEEGGTLFLSGASSFTKGNLRNHPLEQQSPVIAEHRKLGDSLKVSILIDQSGSMSQEAGGIGLDQVRSKVIELISVLSQTDEVEIISFAGQAQILVPRQKVETIKEIPMPLESKGQSLLLTALEKMTIQSKSNENHLILIISDGVFGDQIFSKANQDHQQSLNLSALTMYQRPILMAYTQDDHHWAHQKHPLLKTIPFKQLSAQVFLNQAFLNNQKSKDTSKETSVVAQQVLLKQPWLDQVGTEIPKMKAIDTTRLKPNATLWLQNQDQVVLASLQVGLGQVFALTADDFELSTEAWRKLLKNSFEPKQLPFDVSLNHNEIWLTQMDHISMSALKTIVCELNFTDPSIPSKSLYFKQMTTHSAMADLSKFDDQILKQINSIKIRSKQGFKEIWLNQNHQKIDHSLINSLNSISRSNLQVMPLDTQPSQASIAQIKTKLNQWLLPIWAWLLIYISILLEVLRKK